ncbi:NUDIX hydrolase [Mesorhizobium sp. SP-1A]|uniref:NUDIX hydrolase n=1 Tax=Mesorhizobium sp. SP-1A TaxID=3077840 RepID=UPI0028F71927|nr:NUDIX hydrolase [Mesorhizobium sp. SP-1A]
MSFDLPRGMVLPVDKTDVRLDPAPHPFEARHAQAIAANWEEEVAANPALFNGTMVLLSSLGYDKRRLAGRCHPVRYATMLYWRKNKGEAGIEHSFAFPVLVSRDNALVAIRMGRHTANPGKIYFAAGSFEPMDFIDGQVDLHGNMAREVLEETGLDISSARRDAVDHIFSLDSSTVIFRRYFLDEDAETLARRIEAFVAKEAEPEIERPIVIRSGTVRPEGMIGHMNAIVRWHFENAASSAG